MKFEPGGVLGFSASVFRLEAWLINLPTWGLPGTRWGLTHVGIIGQDVRVPERYDTDNVLLYESTGLCRSPCVVAGHVVDGVQAHFVRDRAMTYEGRLWYWPLKESLRFNEKGRLTRFCLHHLGRPYDKLGAFRSRDLPLAWLQRWLWKREDLHTLFCSEFVAAALRTAGRFHTDNASAWNPNSFIRALRRQGIVGKPILLPRAGK